MNLTIHNHTLRASFSPIGAEWTSLIDRHDDHELLWQGDPSVWAGQAPILFPVIGVQSGDAIRVDGASYPHPKHGFFRKRVCSVRRHVDHEIVFELRSDAETLAQYPFEFAFRVGYSLDGNTLTHTFEVENTGDRPMPFHLGGHPAFQLFGESYIDFDEPETASIYGVSPTGLLTPDSVPYLNGESRIRITPTTFVPDALVFKSLKSRGVELGFEHSTRRIRVDFPDFPYLGIWAKPGAPYVCIEPWIGCADTVGREVEMAEKENVRILQPGESGRYVFKVTVLSSREE
jgi:galactose mutarotase-like enzyme